MCDVARFRVRANLHFVIDAHVVSAVHWHDGTAKLEPINCAYDRDAGARAEGFQNVEWEMQMAPRTLRAGRNETRLEFQNFAHGREK
jgi:hypothetical protein